jgi:IS605 OrfB family transposase
MDRAWTIGGADLVWRDGTYYLHLTQSREAPATTNEGGVLGVDVGIVNLATDSDGAVYSGGKVRGMRAYHVRRRRLVQAVITRSSRKKLHKGKRRESRFSRDTNHCISKALVAKAATSCKILALEDLTHIRERAHVRHEQRYRQHSWAFRQLRQFVMYKAAAAGVPVVLVDPRNTSKTCSVCGHCDRANRPSQSSFCCRSCGFACNADWNAAENIACRAAANRPMVPLLYHGSERAGTSLASYGGVVDIL